jgi:hypothetical protein
MYFAVESPAKLRIVNAGQLPDSGNLCSAVSGQIEGLKAMLLTLRGMLIGFRRSTDRYDNWMAERLAFYATNLRLIRLDRQPASYSIISASRASTVGLWFAGISGAALVLSFAFLIQAYLSLKGDCATGEFVADAVFGAKVFILMHMSSGAFALIAAWLPAWTGGCRNYRRRRHNPQQPPLGSGHEYEGWSEGSGSSVDSSGRLNRVFCCAYHPRVHGHTS